MFNVGETIETGCREEEFVHKNESTTFLSLVEDIVLTVWIFFFDRKEERVGDVFFVDDGVVGDSYRADKVGVT